MTDAEKDVIRRAALVASWKPGIYRTHSGVAASDLYDLQQAVQKLDAERGYPGASTTRVDNDD